MADELSKLASPSWRGIPFPLSSLEVEFEQEHARHAWAYRDGCHLEATGRNPFVFHLSIPFFNGVQAAPIEAWRGQVLYPDLYRQFLAACTDRTTGDLVHPALGTIKCKLKSYRESYEPAPRDGARITAMLHETVDGDELNETISNLSALATAQQSADRLDTLLASTPQPMPELANDTSSFTDMMNGYTSGANGLGRVQSKVANLTLALGRINSVSLWQLALTNSDMQSAILNLQAQPAPSSRSTRTFIVTRDMPLFTIAITLGVKAPDLVTMNPRLARSPLVIAGTSVQYRVAV